ncbi:DUF6094 domain-containing protein [Pseudomonas chlororaphis]|uniref:DUF6094 domain-containing protein n=1 Tax=Pseudomonas chlororaphis TaxID=587753 RepID=UPI001B30C437|nr:DUF6094 domain-containing protein [Pseudomonas chlororaphis]MBP5059611.1 class I SAM-dependent methyltransferase [Pseudomonas chlororaphis]MBP5142244.1 class I SAM-dependent methyltransferase [Pseudomonas chlororaphis]QTT98330.1 class I SAM-dependent methyltransferase [Pseudomonas chlororaphis]
MALMFPRLARNFARNGYYPTDEITLERSLQALIPSTTGRMRIFDPCAGEGVAIAEAAHALGRDQVDALAVEYDQQRAEHARSLLDRVLHSDLMDTMISRQSFGLLWLNPPYGDLVADHAGASQYQGNGRRRLEKLFYQRSLPLLQYGGVLVLIVPHYVLDDELSGWLCNHFTDLRIYAAADPTFKQVVIFGIRVRRQDLAKPREVTQVRDRLQAIGAGQEVAEELPATWPWETEFTEDEDGNVSEVRILTDRFVPIIRAWEMTNSSPNFGRVLTISSSTSEEEAPPEPPTVETGPHLTVPMFPPGRLVCTNAVHHLVENGSLELTPYVRRHLAGDWGELCDEDKQTNQQALKCGDRLFSAYDISAGDETRLWIITEADRSVTTVLLPEDY